ncbi:cation:proton antiporter [Clostridium sp. AM34-11AC]|uniref:cation:proton antiporter domain-containing protein n=1 Tax=Clostridium sp. AM34-11AC TaxID=2305242 RepID=UPI0026ADAEFB
MLTSLGLIFLVGLSAAAICGRLRLPRIIGMLFTGIILGPHVLGLLDDKILSISSELRQMALIIILLKYRKTGGNYGFRKIMRRKIFS